MAITKEQRDKLRKCCDDRHVGSNIAATLLSLLDALDEIEADCDRVREMLFLSNNRETELAERAIVLLSERDRYKARVEMMERALRGNCWCCTEAEPLQIGNSTAVTCEKMKERNILASAGRSGADCVHWQFNEAKYAMATE